MDVARIVDATPALDPRKETFDARAMAPHATTLKLVFLDHELAVRAAGPGSVVRP
ncbi:MAG: hypothetical protein OXU20_05160 [Myxococcales bacterium]|nr:hypothetical protein [Myxococcales bacterium]